MKGNKGRQTLSQKQVLLLGVLVIAVLVGVSIFGKSNTTSPETTTSRSITSKIKTNKDGYRMCLLELDASLTLDQPTAAIPLEESPLPIRFQCAGPSYDQFADKLEAHMHHRTVYPGQWGKYPHPVPAKKDLMHAEGNHSPRHILFFGSSHLRQVVTALLCQYSDHVVKVQRIHGTGKWSLNSFSLHVTLLQNIHLYLVINPPFLYSPEWVQLLEDHVLQMPLQMMDLMVVSKFHVYQPHGHAQPLMEFLMDHEGHAENVTVNADPPSFLDFVDAYEGPLMYVSLFAHYGVSSYGYVVHSIERLEAGMEPLEAARENSGVTHQIDWEFASNPNLQDKQHGTTNGNTGISKQAEEMFTYKPPPPKFGGKHHQRQLAEPTRTPRKNLLAVDGRQYVTELGECAADSQETVGHCITDPEHPKYSEGHRCFGARGGHADLVAHDVVQGIHKLLLSKG